MTKCRLHNRKADLAMPRRSRQCAGNRDRVDIGTYAVEMMLGEPDHVDPELVGEPSLAQRLVDHDAVAFGVAAIRKQEVAESHVTLIRRRRLRRIRIKTGPLTLTRQSSVRPPHFRQWPRRGSTIPRHAPLPRGPEEPFTMYSVLFDLTGWHTERAQPGRVSRKGRAWIVERSRS